MKRSGKSAAAGKGSRLFWLATALAAGALAVLWTAVVAPARALVEVERRHAAELRADIERHFAAEGEPIDVVEDALERAKGRLTDLRGELEAVELELPPEYQPGPDRDPLYFQKQLSELRQRARESGVDFATASTPLGFSQAVTADATPEYLARLGAARRFIEGAREAGIRTVPRVRQLNAPSFLDPDGAAPEIEALPFRVTIAADERSLVRLVQEMSLRESFLSVRGLDVAVRDPASGVFEATLDLAGVQLVRPASPPAETDEATEGETGPGVLVPTRPSRRF
jgi:hypothetical protein